MLLWGERYCGVRDPIRCFSAETDAAVRLAAHQDGRSRLRDRRTATIDSLESPLVLSNRSGTEVRSIFVMEPSKINSWQVLINCGPPSILSSCFTAYPRETLSSEQKIDSRSGSQNAKAG